MKKNNILLFDADETLWDEQVVLQKLENDISNLLKKYNYLSTFISDFIETENANIPIIGYGFPSYTFSLLEVLASKEYWNHIKPEITSIYSSTYKNLTKNPPELFNNTIKTLTKLHDDNYILYVLTRGIHSEQFDKFRRSNLHQFFKEIFVVQDKSEKTYIETSQYLGVKPENLWMIGNSISSDIIPAHNTGYKTIWIPNVNEWSHDRSLKSKKPKETFEINDIIEVIDIVNGK